MPDFFLFYSQYNARQERMVLNTTKQNIFLQWITIAGKTEQHFLPLNMISICFQSEYIVLVPRESYRNDMVK